jgi:hypothetical protein
MTNNYLDWYFSEIWKVVAVELQIENAEWLSPAEIRDHLHQYAADIHDLVEEFFEVYRRWFTATERSDTDHGEIARLSLDRDHKLKQLRDAVSARTPLSSSPKLSPSETAR